VDLGLNGKVALVAGSTRGIGRAIAAAFATEGARVVVTGRNAADVNATVADLSSSAANRVMGHSADLSTTDGCRSAVDAAMSRWHRLDVVISNIGNGKGTRGWDVDDEEWAAKVQENLYPAIRIMRAAAPHLAVCRGVAVLVSSIAGIEALDAPIPYSTAKSALIALTKGLARSLAPQAVRVNAVAPGNILAPGGAWEERLARDRAGVETYINREVPLGRFGTAEEIADAVLFLASDRAAFVTGTCLIVDGGQTRAF
jgi:3-oxoacyl-[acyl-carrier protein] reductase